MIRTTAFIFLFSIHLLSFSQAFQVQVSFKDKAGNGFDLQHPDQFLSGRAIERRAGQGIHVVEEDMPVNSNYIKEILSLKDVVLISKSKWFNDILVEMPDTVLLKKIRLNAFVESAKVLPSSLEKKKQKLASKEEEIQPLNGDQYDLAYGAAFHQLRMLEGDYLHLTSNKGKGMMIAIIDAGFSNFPTSPFFQSMINEKRLIAVHDFVDDDDNVYAHSNHGFSVASTLAADAPGLMVGTAPEASYLLLRSEDSESEYLAEEFFWVEAAEFADSAGTDVCNTSLGYTRFDDSLQNHFKSDMDGKTTRISRAANIAASKGMVMVNSAGNSGNNDWRIIGAPADAPEVLSVGAVDSLEVVANFSSRGPSADGRIKPNVMAMGAGAIVGRGDGTVGKSNGTSFSGPILAGLVACLWQSNPGKSAEAIRYAILLSADRFNKPDNDYGYGVPSFFKADRILKGQSYSDPQKTELMSAFPNPFSDRLMVVTYSPETTVATFRMFDITGRKISETTEQLIGGKEVYLSFGSTFLPKYSGTYILTMEVNGERFERKVVK